MNEEALANAFAERIHRHRGILYKIAHVHCQRAEDRSDLIQEILLELWRAYPRYDDRYTFSTWMHRVAANVAISFFRGQSRRIHDALPIDTIAMELDAADQEMKALDGDLATLYQLIARLDAISRTLILLYLEGYAQDEIADILGISPSNVGTRILRIKQRLQQSWSAEDKS